MPGPKKPTSIDLKIAVKATAKLHVGKIPTQREKTALEKVDAWNRIEDLRAAMSAVPKWLYLQMCGNRLIKTVNDQADRLGVPLRGKTVDLSAVLTWFHDSISKKPDTKDITDDPMLQGDVSPGLERYRNAQADLKEMERDERKGILVRREAMHEHMTRLAQILKSAGETLRKDFGDKAKDVLEESLDEFREYVRSNLGEGDENHE